MAESIKARKQVQKPGEKKYQLTRGELRFIMALTAGRNDAYNKYQAAISTFLSYLAGDKWGYVEGQKLDFELDDETGEVTVTFNNLP